MIIAFGNNRGATAGRLLRLGTVALLACTLGMSSVGIAAADTPSGDDKHPAPTPADDGFTRESMADLGRPEPTPAAPAHVAASTRRTTRIDPKDFTPVHHRARRHHAVQETSSVAKVRPQPHRSPVVRFVYWWNGWVIKTFHTKVGTVLLGTVGAKT